MNHNIAILDTSAPSLSPERAARSFYAERIPLAPPLPDRDLKWRWGVAILAALLLHLAVLTTIDDGFLRKKSPVPAPIPVEVVTELPKPPTQPKPVEKPPEQQKPPEPQPPRSSGGDQEDKVPGTVASAPAVEEKPMTPTTAVTPPIPEPPAVAPAPALPNEPSPQAMPVPPASSPRDTQQALVPAPVPAKKPPAPPAHNETVTAPAEPDTPASASPLNFQLGEGGGDKYLNSVRDEILRHVFYPPTAELFHWTGTPVYRLIIDRRGRLVRLILLQSSGYDILDNAVAKAILASAPFGPPPLSLLGGYDTISGRLFLTLPTQ